CERCLPPIWPLCSRMPTDPTQFRPLSLHDALPISRSASTSSPTFGMSRVISSLPSFVSRASTSYSSMWIEVGTSSWTIREDRMRSEEHTSELQSRFDLVCRLLLEKKTQSYSHSGRQ